MIRPASAVLLAGVMTAAAQAHFAFIGPAEDGATATVVFSDDLSPDEAVAVEKIAGLTLTARDGAGKETAVELRAEKHNLIANLPGTGGRVVYGSVPYGVMQKGDAKPYLLAYHPKAVVGALPAERVAVGEKLPAELVPVVEGGKVRFKLVAGGKPVEGAEVTVIKPDGSKVKAKTAADGTTEPVEGAGRFGAWVRHSEAKAGEHAGKKYEEIRHYATLVVDAGGSK